MNDQEKAREKLNWVMDEAAPNAMWRSERRKMLDAVLSADPRVIAEAMGGEVRVEDMRMLADGSFTLGTHYPTHERTVIVLPPRKVES